MDAAAKADIDEAYKRFPGEDAQAGAARYGFLEGIRQERAAMEEAIPSVIKDVCELDGYTSPPDNPDLLQCTVKELTLILRRHLLGEE